MYERLDNLDKESVEEVAYFIVTEAPSHTIYKSDDEYKKKCHDIYDEYGMSADWEEVWQEIQEYLY